MFRLPGTRPVTALFILAVLAATVGAAEFEVPVPGDIPSDEWMETNGVRIRAVILDTGDIFDTSKPGERKSLYRLANRLHIDTRDSTIEAQLLFDAGDMYSRRVLDESERILRKNRYLYDAHINPANYSDGQVDIVVSTRDVWTLNMGLHASRSGGANRSNIEFEELNLFGWGSKLSVDFLSDVDRDAAIFEYSDNNLGNSWTQLSLKLADRSDGTMTSLRLERPFYALDTRWAGGFEFLQDERVDRFYDSGNPVAGYNHDRNFGQIYAGLSEGIDNDWVSRWTAGVVFDEHRFRPIDLTSAGSLMPVDRKLVYPFVGYDLIEDRYRKTSNHDYIDRTEDVNLGSYLSAQVGISTEILGADDNALIFDVHSGTGFGSPKNSMFLIDGNLNGWLQSDRATNTRLELNARYYRRQSARRLLYARASIVASENPVLDELVDLGGDVGLRGYPLRYRTGEGSALLTLEQRFFTDWYPFKLFRVGGAIFADAGRTFGRNPFGPETGGWLTDVGLGLRLGSTRSGSGKMVHFDIAFPLNGDSSIDNAQFLLETRQGF